MDKDKKIARKIVKAILDDMSDRSGLGDEFDSIDAETQAEIKKEWEKIIAEILP